jgi:hypothetical protein
LAPAAAAAAAPDPDKAKAALALAAADSASAPVLINMPLLLAVLLFDVVPFLLIKLLIQAS